MGQSNTLQGCESAEHRFVQLDMVSVVLVAMSRHVSDRVCEPYPQVALHSPQAPAMHSEVGGTVGLGVVGANGLKFSKCRLFWLSTSTSRSASWE